VATDGHQRNREFLAAATRGFDTSGIRYQVSPDGASPNGVPSTATSRAYLRNALPAIYQEGDFGLRFVGALESVLDPIVAVLDSFHAHLDPELAPRDMLLMLAAWLGVERDEGWPEDRLREIVLHAAELHKLRGTREGLDLQLKISFPDTPLRVEESGGVFWAEDEASLPATKDPPGFVVYCDVPLSESEASALARAIEYMKPVHVNYRLRVKAPRKSEQEAKP
jgi:phage tail-like protein